MKLIPDLTIKDLLRFHSKVQRLGEDDCWPWSGGKTKDGYGVFSICRNNKETKYYAHRIALYITDQNQEEVARHSCDNPQCCNPNHLLWEHFKITLTIWYPVIGKVEWDLEEAVTELKQEAP